MAVGVGQEQVLLVQVPCLLVHKVLLVEMGQPHSDTMEMMEGVAAELVLLVLHQQVIVLPEMVVMA